MEGLAIRQTEETDEAWVFSVSDDTRTWTVTVPRVAWQKLTEERETPAELVRASFAFLLDRESPASILSTFSITDIITYFPDYPEKINTYL